MDTTILTTTYCTLEIQQLNLKEGKFFVGSQSLEKETQKNLFNLKEVVIQKLGNLLENLKNIKVQEKSLDFCIYGQQEVFKEKIKTEITDRIEKVEKLINIWNALCNVE